MLLVGGGGETRTLRVVARYADEWNMSPVGVERYREKVAALEAHCEEFGRDPGTIARSMMCGFLVAESEGELQLKLGMVQPTMRGLASLSASAALEALRERGWLVGTPALVKEQLDALSAEGITRVMLQNINLAHMDFDALELIAAEILPEIDSTPL
jgi:alkanesulfonate monooxygenase SsuD/methylene tetrahydromethanopterin reductase-like flavin-dependent oxidoreductase (luciferase family)